MENNLVIAEALNGQVRIHAADTTAMIEEARKLHDLWPTSCAALGRVMTVTALMASDLKKPDEIVVSTINGHGPAGTIVAQGNGKGEVRGFIGNPGIYILNEKTGKLDVGMAVGKDGNLQVTKDLGLKEPFTGVVRLQSGEIGDDFAYYFAASEQIPSVVAVGVLVNPDESVKAAGGMIMQLLPNATEEAISALEKIAGEMKPMSSYIDEGKTPQEIINLLFDDARILETKECHWHCDCSKEKFTNGLALIHEEDLKQMIEEDHKAEVTCQYCGAQYTFDEDELKAILEKHNHVEDRKSLDR